MRRNLVAEKTKELEMKVKADEFPLAKDERKMTSSDPSAETCGLLNDGRMEKVSKREEEETLPELKCLQTMPASVSDFINNFYSQTRNSLDTFAGRIYV